MTASMRFTHRDFLHVPRFRESIYRDLDIGATLDFFDRRFIDPLRGWIDIAGCTAVDAACGFGWFALAFLRAGGGRAFAVDVDLSRLNAARSIATVFGVERRLSFINASIDRLPLRDTGADLFVSIETLEHLDDRKAAAAILEIERVAAKAIVITTPNKWFPVIAHDTRIPFLHWFLPQRRSIVARLFGRSEMDEGNHFLSPSALRPFSRRFRRVSRCLTFGSYREYRNHFPVYLPYGQTEKKRWQLRPSITKRLLFATAAAALGTSSHCVLPSLAGVYVRRPAELHQPSWNEG